jgi:hypothetical protein
LGAQNILVQRSPESILLYDPVAHALGQLENATRIAPQLFSTAMNVVNAPTATLLWLAGDYNLIDAVYNDGESLLWRDAGVLLFCITLVAESLGLGSCILGISGEPMISQLFSGHLQGFGAIVIGTPSSYNSNE